MRTSTKDQEHLHLEHLLVEHTGETNPVKIDHISSHIPKNINPLTVDNNATSQIPDKKAVHHPSIKVN